MVEPFERRPALHQALCIHIARISGRDDIGSLRDRQRSGHRARSLSPGVGIQIDGQMAGRTAFRHIIGEIEAVIADAEGSARKGVLRNLDDDIRFVPPQLVRVPLVFDGALRLNVAPIWNVLLKLKEARFQNVRLVVGRAFARQFDRGARHCAHYQLGLQIKDRKQHGNRQSMVSFRSSNTLKMQSNSNGEIDKI